MLSIESHVGRAFEETEPRDASHGSSGPTSVRETAERFMLKMTFSSHVCARHLEASSLKRVTTLLMGAHPSVC